MKSVLTPLAKNVLQPLSVTAAVSVQMQLFKRKFMDQARQH